MTQEKIDLLAAYAASLACGEDVDGRANAQRLGWITDAGAVTKSGEEAAKAFVEQQKTRSAFRVG
ncbi:MAG: hypothetical protein ACFB00_02510 [Parvularculaceae bacterium]